MFRGLVAQATVYRKAAVLGTEVLLSLSFVCLFFVAPQGSLWENGQPEGLCLRKTHLQRELK